MKTDLIGSINTGNNQITLKNSNRFGESVIAFVGFRNMGTIVSLHDQVVVPSLKRRHSEDIIE